MIVVWIKGIIATRLRQLLISACGIVAATALIGVIGVFGISSSRTMTQRALTAVPVDWQVAIASGSDEKDLTAKLSEIASIRAARTTGYADATGFSANTNGTTQTTGAAQILGISTDYAATFPGQIRLLLGRADGTLLTQQTAANLHATVGDRVTLTPIAGPSFDIVVDGIVDLPNADAMFQTIGPQKGPNATAPPDNVALMPLEEWNLHFAAGQTPGNGARLQIHASLNHSSLPPTPDAAFLEVSGKAKHFEVLAAGSANIGDNLAARLDAVRQDALFARILLLFLGLPGIVLALLLTISITRANATRLRREQALLGLRGANSTQITALAFVEATLIAGVGSLCGMALAAILAKTVLHIELNAAPVMIWLAASAFTGFILALAVVVIPALLELHGHTVASRRIWLTPTQIPLWQRSFVDLGLIAIAGVIFWHSASTGYQVVLAPEGVAATAVDYTAFLAPLLFWTGSGLLTLRLVSLALRKGKKALQMIMAPLASTLAAPVAATLSRQHARIAAGTALVALAFVFATTTAIFSTTYNAQLLVDARLTNGADVTVTGTTAAPAGDQLENIRTTTGILSAEPMLHRFAYVGKDLQDIYGIDPARIGKATDIVDVYFGDRNASTSMARLAATPDGVLVSQETVTDFQLLLGDVVNLRLQDTLTNQSKTVPFHFIGVVKEFPTAPHDSFLVANGAYLAAQTSNPRAEIVLIRAAGDAATLATTIRQGFGTSTPLRTTDISQAVHLIGSSLTAVDLRMLGAINMGFAIIFVALAAGLTLWLGQNERARTNAILLSLGASRTSIRSFLWSEALILLGFGLPIGGLVGTTVAWMLVRLLNGVFDPPPDTLAYPWAYLGLVLTGALIATIAAVYAQGVWSKEWAVQELRAGR